MPLTLYGYILRELLKVLGTAALVLTVVMSVAFAIMSVTQGFLGPWALVKIVFYVLPGMLTIALPFAAALAGTLVFFRMSQDNEITACAVSGISYLGLLMPVLLLGVGMTAGMFWFSNWVVPRFWRLAEREGTADAVRVVVGKIQRREVFEWSERGNKLVIYADAADMKPLERSGPDSATVTPYSRLVLQGVAVGRLDEKTDAVRAAYTAGQAVIDLYRDESDRTTATMLLRDVSQNDPKSGGIGHAQEVRIGEVEIPTQFSDRPQFMSLRRLQRLAMDPLRSSEVRMAKRELVESMARYRILTLLEQRLSSAGGTVELHGSDGQSFRLTVPVVERDEDELVIRASGENKVTLVQYQQGFRVRSYLADGGSIEFADSLADEEPLITLTLDGPLLRDPTLPTGESQLKRLSLPWLRSTAKVVGTLSVMELPELLREARAQDVAWLTRARKRMEGKLVELQREIGSRVHERAAVAVNCSLVLALGVVMSIWLRHQTPLAIFFWCFMPTVAAFLTISSGQQVMGWDDLPASVGAAVIWSGNAGLAAIVAGVYMRLRRN